MHAVCTIYCTDEAGGKVTRHNATELTGDTGHAWLQMAEPDTVSRAAQGDTNSIGSERKDQVCTIVIT